MLVILRRSAPKFSAVTLCVSSRAFRLSLLLVQYTCPAFYCSSLIVLRGFPLHRSPPISSAFRALVARFLARSARTSAAGGHFAGSPNPSMCLARTVLTFSQVCTYIQRARIRIHPLTCTVAAAAVLNDISRPPRAFVYTSARKARLNFVSLIFRDNFTLLRRYFGRMYSSRSSIKTFHDDTRILPLELLKKDN